MIIIKEAARKTVYYLFGWKKLVGTESSGSAMLWSWTVENGLPPENIKWYTGNWEGGKVLEKDGKKPGTGNIQWERIASHVGQTWH